MIQMDAGLHGLASIFYFRRKITMNNQDQPNLLVARILVEPGIARIMHKMSEELPEVFRHSLNVAYLTAEICYSQIGGDMRTDLIYDKMDCIRGALLHDIGKLDIPKEVLHKKDELTMEEVRILMEHPKLGYHKLLELEESSTPSLPIKFSKTVKDIVLHHHESSDGTGYPDNIREIETATRLVSLCDRYDAMTEDRPYRSAKSKYSAYQCLCSDNLDKDLFLLLVSCDNR